MAGVKIPHVSSPQRCGSEVAVGQRHPGTLVVDVGHEPAVQGVEHVCEMFEVERVEGRGDVDVVGAVRLTVGLKRRPADQHIRHAAVVKRA